MAELTMDRAILAVLMLIALIVPEAAGMSPAQTTIRNEKPVSATTSNSELETTIPQFGNPVTVDPSIVREPSEFALLHARYRFENDGTGRKEVIARVRILSYARVSQWSELSFEFKPSKERIQILYVRVLKKDGRVVTVDTGRGPLPQGVFRQEGAPGLDFNDKRVTMPPLSPGDIIEYDVETIIHTAITPGQFYEIYTFLPCSAIDDQGLEIDVPADRAVKVKTKPGLATSVVNRNGRRVYRWNALHQGSECDDKGILTGRDLKTKTPDVQLSSFADWEEVGSWYAEMEKSRRVPSPEVRAKADELTQGLSTDLEKVAALYDFVARRVKYFSMVAFGMGGYEPHTADEVLRTMYGDCKDKDALLGALLDAKGFHTSSVLINPIRELEPDMPSPWPFTHVITVLPLGKNEIWMDTSSGIVPFRMLSYALRKKKALVIPPDGIPHFEETPIEAPMLSTWTEEIEGKVGHDGMLEAAVNITARGDAEIPLREVFLNVVEGARPAIVERTIGRNFNGQVVDVKISDPIATREPFRLSFQISEPGAVTETGTRYKFGLPLLNFDMASGDGKGSEKENYAMAEPLRVGPLGKYALNIKLNLAKGPKPILPPQIHVERTYGSYRSSFRFEGDSLIVERRLEITKDEVPATRTNEYRSFAQEVLADFGLNLEVQVDGRAQ